MNGLVPGGLRLCRRSHDPLLTIVMPICNEGPEPRRTVESLHATADPSLFEIVAIDDSTTPAQDTLDDFSNLRYVRNERRIGCAASRQLGVDLARTPYIMMIDAHMRFRDDDWYRQILRALSRHPDTIFCCRCLGLDRENMDVTKPRGSYYGATLQLIDETATPERPAREVLEPKWAPAKRGKIYDVACVLGAAYATSRSWFCAIRGLRGLRMWGSDEVFLSLKSWLAGGDCKILTTVGIGHMFREDAPYRTPVADLVFNKLLISATLLPAEVSAFLEAAMPEDQSYREAKEMIAARSGELARERQYHSAMRQRSFSSYCTRFELSMPAALRSAMLALPPAPPRPGEPIHDEPSRSP